LLQKQRLSLNGSICRPEFRQKSYDVTRTTGIQFTNNSLNIYTQHLNVGIKNMSFQISVTTKRSVFEKLCRFGTLID